MIRHFKPEDTDNLINIWRMANAIAHPFLPTAFVKRVENDMRSLYLPNAETWVLENNGTNIGFTALIGNEIGGLFLNPAFHGQGFGRALVDHAFELKGPLKVEVFEKNMIGRRFYDGYGFIELKQHLHGASGETVLTLFKD
ncbi:GNAT family N-acetyltransferase [Sneathiella marina]|uniref:GNAT family N-acetyltransferase n=1 Tax=Sneathiella marina TaxID=2950108 RepID=A0ABY4W4E4_9PROT|nr:GNAT family N-acetyltransferase [Sneathiella marina]USG59531.1 GNAT family N-acetyltransferase [Sneathiella marina]